MASNLSMQPKDAAEINDLFFRASASERALILHNLAETPLLATDAAKAVIGTGLDEASLKKAAAAAQAIMSPAADARGPVEYRKHVGGIMVMRALSRAAAKAG